MRRPATTYGVALAALVAAVLLRWLLDPLMGDTLPLVTLFGAVAIAVWIGGTRPALLVVVLGYFACAYLFIEPRGSLGLTRTANLIGLLAYFVTCFIIIGFGASMRAAQRRVVTDGSERKQTEDQLRRSAELLTFLIDRSPTGFYIVDADFRISHVNADSQARAFRNVSPAIGRRLDEAMRILWPEPLATEIIEIFRHTLETGEPYRSPGLVSPRNDLDAVETYEWQLDRISLPDGTYGVVCYYYDTTRLREAEQQLRESEAQLRASAEHLREADRRKDEFLATLAHELRNPLAPISNALSALRLATHNPESLEQARAMMERQLGQMVRLIDDLLDVSRISRGKLQLRLGSVELASVIQQAVETCRPLAESSHHEVTITLPPQPVYLDGDPVRLAQVFSNLLNNSCKFTEAGGSIRLTAERQGSEVVVAVQDNGIGVPTDQLDSVFEMFVQVDSTLERSQGGLGLGLTLVKRLVELHGGRIEARSEGPGRGREFVVRLPALSEKPRPPAPEPMEPPAATTELRILVIDDNRDGADTLAMLLKLSGNETHTAYDGQEAVDAAARLRPDVILLDIGLPKLNGYDACRAIRGLPWGGDAVIIALSGLGQDEDKRKSTEAGFDGHLVKPVDHATLMKLIASLCPDAVSRPTERRR